MDEDHLKFDMDVDVDAYQNELQDETADEDLWGVGVAVAPVGFSLDPSPNIMPNSRCLINRKVLWAIPVASTGASGWIRSVVDGGP